MNNSINKPFAYLPFYLLPIGIFIFMICPFLFSEGLFMDGLIYSAVSKNLANDIGSFWNPQFTAIYLADFHEHPPLAFGIQSIFFKLFGEHFIVDKLFSIFTYCIVGFILIKIWRIKNESHSWLPLFIWLLFPLVAWASTNNMLENTLTIFTTLSVYFYFKKNQTNTKIIFLFLAGLVLSLGFLTKGFVAFFPWSLPFIYWLFTKKINFKTVIIDTTIFLLFTLLPLIILVLTVPEAKLSLQKYIDIQVIGSLKNVVTVNSRFSILFKLFTELLPIIGLATIIIVTAKAKKIPLSLLKNNLKNASVFIALGLTSVLPIMISLKQNGFYIIPSFPFFAIGIGLILIPLVEKLFDQINFNSIKFNIFKWFSYSIFILSLTTSIYFSNQIMRDKILIQDVHKIEQELSEGSVVNIFPEMHGNWSLHGYFSRGKNISLDDHLNLEREYLIIDKSLSLPEERLLNYQLIDLNTEQYFLYKRK